MIGRLEIALLSVALTGGAFFFWLNRSNRPAENPGNTGIAAPAIDLKTNSQPDIFNRLNDDQKIQVKQAVQFFCNTKYDRPSCLQYIITCGEPCFHVIDRDRLALILNDFNLERGKQKLAPVNFPKIKEVYD